MAQKFYVDNLTSRFIKCLLWDTYIPTVSIWKPGRNLIKGFTYITKDKYISVAKKDFIAKEYLGNYSSLETAPEVVENLDSYITIENKYYVLDKQQLPSIVWTATNSRNVLGPQDGKDSEYFETKSPFVENVFYPGVTTNFKSISALYDPDTHQQLGQYLRMLRDIYDLDLMPFYNCFNGTTSDSIRISKNAVNSIIDNNTVNDGMITYIVPIRFNQAYSIYFNTEIPFKIKLAYYDGLKAKPFTLGSNEYPAITVRNCSTDNPYIFKPFKIVGENFVFEHSSVALLEDYLVLLIQLPKFKRSNLTVLEGDYSGIKNIKNNNVNKLSEKHFGDVSSLSVSDLNAILKPLSSLTKNFSDNSYAFSDRLIEYLLYSPIINKDRIKKNIDRIQRYISSDKAKKVFGQAYAYRYTKDIWDNNLRCYLYDLVTQKQNNPLYLDINGYVDKDVEFIVDAAKIDAGGDFNV